MAFLRRLKSSTLFRCLVVPALLLCCIFRSPAFQWIAVAAVGIWLTVVLAGTFSELYQKRKQKKPAAKPVESAPPPDEEEPQATEQAQPTDEQAQPTPPTSENALFLIRQINYRITEQLKASYPMVAWLWVKRPDAEALCQGGVWRIRTSNTDPFNFGEVKLTKTGKLTITMLQAVPLKDAPTVEQDDSDLKQEEMLERPNVRTWYEKQGQQILYQLIDDLNTQGHKSLTIQEDGSVVISVNGEKQSVEQIGDFPPRMLWEEFCQMLREDEITAEAKNDCLSLSWK